MTMAKARAVVQVGDKKFEMQQFELPRIGADDALMRVEACGIWAATSISMTASSTDF